MPARAFEHGECAVNIGAKISFRLLNGGHDVGAGREMENPIRAGTSGVHRPDIGDVRFHDLKLRIAVMLSQIGPSTDNKAIEHTHAAAFGDQAINQMAADEPRASCDQVNADRFRQDRTP